MNPRPVRPCSARSSTVDATAAPRPRLSGGDASAARTGRPAAPSIATSGPVAPDVELPARQDRPQSDARSTKWLWLAAAAFTVVVAAFTVVVQSNARDDSQGELLASASVTPFSSGTKSMSSSPSARMIAKTATPAIANATRAPGEPRTCSTHAGHDLGDDGVVVADEQRVAREHSPGLRAAIGVDHILLDPVASGGIAGRRAVTPADRREAGNAEGRAGDRREEARDRDTRGMPGMAAIASGCGPCSRKRTLKPAASSVTLATA